MEPSKEAIAVRITRLNRHITGKVTTKLNKTIDRETLLDAIAVLYDECNDDPVKKCDELVRIFVDKFRCTIAEVRRERVCFSDFKVLHTIGRGHFGEVQMVREKQTGDVYALKTLRKEQARSRILNGGEDERDVLVAANGPWIPKLQYAFQDTNNLYLVMELCSGGDLAGLLSRCRNPLSEKDSAFYIAEVAHALKTLHAMGYVHRDVKPENIFIDRCGHVKLGDVGSCARLSGATRAMVVGTPDYVAPELLAAAHCATTHTVCYEFCSGVQTATSACDYWSLGVVAFELVTFKKPFSSGDDDSLAQILSNIQRFEQEANVELPFDKLPNGPSSTWRSLVAGLLQPHAARRFNYLNTLQHPALAHLSLHAIRDQVPPWVPHVRGPEDHSYFSPPPRTKPPPTATSFRNRLPFAGQLPFVGYTYVAPEESEDSSSGFNASHDCTAIDLATYKSAEKLAAMRAREITSLQGKLAEAEAAASLAAERARLEADAEAERQRARLQAEITALSLQNKRLERQVEVEKEERMALQRTNQELSSGIAERSNAELRATQAHVAQLQNEKGSLKEEVSRLELRLSKLQAENSRALTDAETARVQQQHYKDIIHHVQDLRHRRLTELNVRAIDTIAKERALRRQTLSGGDADGARLATAEANAAKESRLRAQAEGKLAAADAEADALRFELEEVRAQLASIQGTLSEKRRASETALQQRNELEQQLNQQRVKTKALEAQVQEYERTFQEAARREAALEEQSMRTEVRYRERLDEAEGRVTAALQDDARRREKVNSLEQLVRQLEREVCALEKRTCTECAVRAAANVEREPDVGRGDRSDTESVPDVHTNAHVALLKEQLERAELQLQARAEEIATLRQETRAANLAKWRKEREFNELSLEAKGTARDLKRAEERLSAVLEARRTADKTVSALQSEIATLRPQHEHTTKEVEHLTKQLTTLQKERDTLQTETDRSRNDIRKLKSELQYSEKRRLHAEEQEELSSRERAQMRDELSGLRTQNNDLVLNNKALQDACGLLEDQLTELEKLTDHHEVKNKDLESDVQRMRSELEACRNRLAEAERLGVEKTAAAGLAAQRHDEARDQARAANTQLQLLRERLESREARVAELESRTAALEGEVSAGEAALASAARRVRELQEESATLRTRAHHHHANALQLQQALADAQEEVASAREASEAAATWWRTRETKADATIRQQAKLIDFLQAKVEEANRKKCSLSNKLFGRSGRRAAGSPPLMRVNRELRGEVERLRAKLAAHDICPPTPRREKLREKPKRISNGLNSFDVSDGVSESSLLIIWPDGTRERMPARSENSTLILSKDNRKLRGHLLSPDVTSLPYNESNRAFKIKVEGGAEDKVDAVAVCATIAEREEWMSKLQTTPTPAGAVGYRALVLYERGRERPTTALHVAPNAIAIGYTDGLHSLRGPVHVEWESEVSPARMQLNAVHSIAATHGRALLVCSGILAHGGLLALGSALRRSATLKPCVGLTRVKLSESTPPHLVNVSIDDTTEGVCAVAACGRRVILLRFEAASTQFKVARSITVDRPPSALLLTTNHLFIAGEKPLKINLPSGALEVFATDDLTISAALKSHSHPKAIVLIGTKPIEMLICYAECGVFLDENGKRTRTDDPKWSTAVHSWQFVAPFLYAVGTDRISIIYLTEEAYRAPPCTCETSSLGSATSECYLPEVFNYKIKEPALLGTAPNGIIVRSKNDDGYTVSLVEGAAAFRSIGASVESLETTSESKGSSMDLALSLTDLSHHDMSNESVEVNTEFLADIRKRAKQLRNKNRNQCSDDVIKEILTTEVGLKCTPSGKKFPAATSEFDSDSESDSEADTKSTKDTTDLCAEMFARQVRFK